MQVYEPLLRSRGLLQRGLRDGARSSALLQRNELACSLQERLHHALLRPELERTIEDLFCALGVAAAEEDLSEPAVDLAFAGSYATRRDERGLRVVEPSGVEVHPSGREEDLELRLLRRVQADLLDEIRPFRSA